MSEVTLVAEHRSPDRQRTQQAPAGRGEGPGRPLRARHQLPQRVGRPAELRHALTGPAGMNTLINLSVDGVIHPTIVKSLQRDPIKRNVGHVDFIVVRLDEVIEISVAFHLEGEAKAVSAEGGLVDPAVDTITVRTTPQNVPGAFIYDISDLQVGDVVRASKLTMPEGVELVDDPEMAIVTRSPHRSRRSRSRKRARRRPRARPPRAPRRLRLPRPHRPRATPRPSDRAARDPGRPPGDGPGQPGPGVLPVPPQRRRRGGRGAGAPPRRPPEEGPPAAGADGRGVVRPARASPSPCRRRT